MSYFISLYGTFAYQTDQYWAITLYSLRSEVEKLYKLSIYLTNKRIVSLVRVDFYFLYLTYRRTFLNTLVCQRPYVIVNVRFAKFVNVKVSGFEMSQRDRDQTDMARLVTH